MAPAVISGDHIYVEGVTYLFRKPVRGDLVAFTNEGLQLEQKPGIVYLKRVVGLPGERIRISGETLYVNEKAVDLDNCAGRIKYSLLPYSRYPSNPDEIFTVPAGEYYLLGDNAEHSMDSRHWGGVPQKNILGRAVFRYWPSSRIGGMK
jgi:signal peptidase I